MSYCATPLWAASIAEGERLNGHTVVWANGCFDLLHAGHVRALEEAKMLGEFLIVGLNSDRSVLGLKGRAPFIPEAQRAAMLCALRCVDLVVMFDDPTPASWVELIEPDVVFVGYDQDPAMARGLRSHQFWRPRICEATAAGWFGVSTGAVVRRVRGEP